MALDLTGGNPGDKSAANIIKIINAAADAHTAQTELQKQILLKQVGDKMDLAQKGKEQMQQKNIDYNYPTGDGSMTPPATPMANVLNPASGTADSGTPAAVGGPSVQGGQSPMASVVNPAAPQAQPTPNSVLTTPTSAANGGGSIVPQSPTQAPSNPILNSPSAAPGGNPIMPTSIQYNNLGYKPVEAPQILAERQKNGQSINHADTAYVQALNKVKAGTASQGEIDMVNKMNNQDSKSLSAQKLSNQNIIPNVQNTSETGSSTIPTNQTEYQQHRAAMEAKFDMPSGSMWYNPGTSKWEANPIYLKQIEAKNTAEASVAARQPENDVKTAQNIDKALDPSYYRAGAFGDSKKVFDRGERLESMIDYANKYQEGGADSRQIVELATGFQAQLTGGNGRGNYQQVQDLIPHTMVGNVNKMAEWLTNNPRGAKQQAFVDRMMQSVHRENATVQAQMERTKFQRLATFDDFANRNPEQFNDMLRSNGVDPDKYAAWKKNGYEQKSAVQDSQEASGVSGTTIFNPKTGKTMTLSADGKSWE